MTLTRLLPKAALISSALLAATVASATPVLLGTVIHNYGSDAGRVAPTSQGIFPGGCDTVNATSLTVNWSNSTGCNRYFDVLDFSALNYASIDRFELTVSFASTNNSLETWRVRPASNQYVTQAATSALNLSSVGAGGATQTFAFNETNLSWVDTHPSVAGGGDSIFDNIVESGQFFLWLQSAGILTNQSFTLNSVQLAVYGTASTAAVPLPGSLALAGLGLLALGALRRRG